MSVTATSEFETDVRAQEALAVGSKDLLGCVGDVVRFKWGRLGRLKTGHIVKMSDKSECVIYVKKRGGHHRVSQKAIVRNLSK